MEIFFVPALPLFSHVLIWEFNLTQAIVEGKVHIITDAIYVVCQSGPKHQFLNMSSSLPTCPLTERMRSCHPWLGSHGYECCAWNPDPEGFERCASRPGRSSCHTVPNRPATAVRGEFLPVCEVTDLSPPKELWASIHLRGNKANARISTTTTTSSSSRATDAWPNPKTYPYELIHLGMFVSINLQFCQALSR